MNNKTREKIEEIHMEMLSYAFDKGWNKDSIPEPERTMKWTNDLIDLIHQERQEAMYGVLEMLRRRHGGCILRICCVDPMLEEVEQELIRDGK